MKGARVVPCHGCEADVDEDDGARDQYGRPFCDFCAEDAEEASKD